MNSNAQMYGDFFKGSLTPEQCDMILKIREAGEVPELQHTIFNFPYEVILEAREKGMTCRQIVTGRGENLEQYIGALRPYQTVGTAFMYYSPRSIIGDSVGLGKTAEIAALINVLKARGELSRFIMAVDSTSAAQSTIELMRFTGLRVALLPSQTADLKKVMSKYDLTSADGLIIKHSCLKNSLFISWLSQYVGANGKSSYFNTFILDESSIIKSATSQIHDYAAIVASQASRVHLMNATVLDKNLMEVYYQLDVADPELLPEEKVIKNAFVKKKLTSHWEWRYQGGAKRKAKVYHNEFDGYKNQAIFKHSISLVYLSRDRKMVGLQLPHVYKVYTIDASEKQKKFLQKGYRYNEVLNCPSLITDKTLGSIEFTPKEVPKLARLCELVTNEFAGQKTIIYCFHVDAQHVIKTELEKRGLKCAIINGEEPSGSNRDFAILDIQNSFNNGDTDIVITNIKRSLNLNGGSNLIFYSSSAAVGVMEQVRGRLDRSVDDSIKTFVLLLYKDTGEQELIENVARQRAKSFEELLCDTKVGVSLFYDMMGE